MMALLLPLLAVLALAVGLMLLLRGGAGLPGCGPRSGCDAVIASRWGHVGPVPVALLGVIAYAVMAIGAGASHPAVRSQLPAATSVFAAKTLLVTSLASAGAGVWFTFVQAVLIGRLCRYCMVAHGLAIGVAGLAVAGPMPGAELAGPAMIAGALVLGLIVAQSLIRAKTYAVVASAPTPVDSAESTEDPAGVDPALPTPERADGTSDLSVAGGSRATRQVTLAGGNVIASIDAWPLIGSPDARHVLMFLFDHTCATCRETFRVVFEAVDLAGDELAVLCVPVPQSRACNPLVTGKGTSREDACAYARLALCLHAVSPAASIPFARWSLGPPNAYCFPDAMRYAAGLAPGLAEAWPPGPRLEAQLRAAIGIFRSAQAQQVPLLLLPRSAIGGIVPSPRELLRILGNELDLRPQPRAIPPQVAAPQAPRPISPASEVLIGGGGFNL